MLVTLTRSDRKPLLTTMLLLGAIPAASCANDVNDPTALEIRVAPQDYLVAFEARSPGLGYDGVSPFYDLVLQTIFFINRSDGKLTVQGGQIDLLADGQILQSSALSTVEMAAAQTQATALQQMGFPAGLEVQYSATSVLPEGVTIAPTLELESGTSGLVADNYLVVRGLPDQVRVKVRATDVAGREVSSEITVPVKTYETTNRYILPLEPGEWYVLAHPGIRGHHRWTAATEHGMDITMVDPRGSWARGDADAWRTGRVPRWEDWYAYNKKVLAAADGEVVEVSDDVEFPLDFWNRRDGESLAAYRGRIGQRQTELFLAPRANPAAVAGGNYILIEHAGGEYSYYAHLAYGTIRVQPGQTVTQGEHIAGLGGTGEAPAVHLHFQILDGPSLMGTRTLPVQFANIHVNEAFVDAFEPKIVFQPGYFISNRD